MINPSDKIQPPVENITENSTTTFNLKPLSLQFKKLCRICLGSDKENEKQLIVPCKCSGSLEFVHKSCYHEWIRHLYDRLESHQDKIKMQNEGFQCQICKTNIKVEFEFKRSLVNKAEFGRICRNSIPMTVTIIVFFMIAIAAFSYLVYFADLTKNQFERQNGSQGFFTVIGIIIVVVFFLAGVVIFLTKYLWIQKMFITNLRTQDITN